jgi:hypothetical protein
MDEAVKAGITVVAVTGNYGKDASTITLLTTLTS